MHACVLECSLYLSVSACVCVCTRAFVYTYVYVESGDGCVDVYLYLTLICSGADVKAVHVCVCRDCICFRGLLDADCVGTGQTSH